MASTTESPTTSTEPPEIPRNESKNLTPPPPSASSDFTSQVKTPKFDFPSFSQLLEGVVRAANSASSQQANPLVVENVRLEVQFKMSHQEALACVTAKATESAQVQTLGGHLPTTSSDTSPSTQTTEHTLPPITQTSQCSSSPLNNVINITCQGQKTSFPQEKSLSLPETKSINAAATNEPICETPRAPHWDGYSWRKYGQKQVKTPESSRSYYRCTHVDCSVKKTVLHSDKSGQILAVDYKGEHNHDPPPQIQRSHNKGNSLKKQTSAAPVESMANVSVVSSESKQVDDVCHSSSGKENELAIVLYHESDKRNSDNRCESKGGVTGEEQVKRPEDMQVVMVNHSEPSNSSDHLMTDVVKESNVITGQKRRMKERSKECPMTPQRSVKEPKIVVHSAGDAAITSDGYRWRKYGQKMVKGNPHPRSYYRCTSAGCPVRKHVERAVNNSAAIVVTYEGKHDHDTPVLKKRLSCSSSTASTTNIAVSAASAADSKTPSCQMESIQPSQETSNEPKEENTTENAADERKTPELGTEKKMLESAQTLLSIGIELKSC